MVRIASPLIGFILATISGQSFAAAPAICESVKSITSKTPTLVSASGKAIRAIGETLLLGEVLLSDWRTSEGRLLLAVERTQQADSELPNREYVITPSQDPIKCPRKWLYEISIDFSSSTIRPGDFSRNIALFSRNADGLAGTAASTVRMTGRMNRSWIAARAHHYDGQESFEIGVENSGNAPTGAISVFFDIDGTFEIKANDCDGKRLPAGGKCKLLIAGRDTKQARQTLVAAEKDGPTWRFSLSPSPDGKELIVAP